MKDTALVLKTGLHQLLRMRLTLSILITVSLMCVAGLTVAIVFLQISPLVRTGTPDRQALELYLSLIVFTSCLIGSGVNLNAFAFQNLTREKSRGNIEALLATPLTIRTIWTGKSLAIFIPGLFLGEIFAIITLLVLNFIYFTPKIGFLINPWIILNGFVAVPFIYLCLSLLVYLIGLTGNPATGNIIAQIFLPFYASLMINLAAHNILDAGSWPFTLANFGTAAVIALCIFLLQPGLKKEKIILSC